MNKSEFFCRPADFTFELSPLDVNLTKMQYTLRERMKLMTPQDGTAFEPIVERYVSRNPERAYHELTVVVSKVAHPLSDDMFELTLTVTGNDGQTNVQECLFTGSWQWLNRFIDSRTTPGGRSLKWSFFTLCKAHALWVDHLITQRQREAERKALEAELEREKGQGLHIFYCGGTLYRPDDWPAQELRQLLPQATVSAPAMPATTGKAVMQMGRTLLTDDTINVFVAALDDDLKVLSQDLSHPSLDGFNLTYAFPTNRLGGLGGLLCRGGRGFCLGWRKGADAELGRRVDRYIRVLLRRLADRRVEQFNAENGDYVEVADLAVSLYGILLPRLPHKGALTEPLESECPVNIKGKPFRLVLTVSPLTKDFVSTRLRLIHQQLEAELSYLSSCRTEEVRQRFYGPDAMMRVYQSVCNVMSHWPTPVELLRRNAERLTTSCFDVVPGDALRIVRLDRQCRLTVMGHTFDGVDDVKRWAKDGGAATPRILERRQRFPCFDSEDYATENRYYRHFLFCADEADAAAKQKDFEQLQGNGPSLIGGHYPGHLRPLLYYADESAEMTLVF